jgi:hypothetical protein
MPIPTFQSSEKPLSTNIISNSVTDSSTPNSSSVPQRQNTSAPNKTEAEEAADRLYEERMEDEYAKREGGA